MADEANERGAVGELEDLIALIDRHLQAANQAPGPHSLQKVEALTRVRAKVQRTLERARRSPTTQNLATVRQAVAITRMALEGTSSEPTRE